MKPSLSADLRRAYELMRAHYGHQHWWPGETPFEVCVGAILTQNTNWGNVERAIANLQAGQVLSPAELYKLPVARLADLIRPTGYYNVKAQRLRSFLETLVEKFGGDLAQLFAGPIVRARERLLAINGIGPETADSMLLYAGGRLSFVVDAYTRRIFLRHHWCCLEDDYEELQTVCRDALSQKGAADLVDYWQDYHAQLVNVGKEFCRAREPRCDPCPLKPLLPAEKGRRSQKPASLA